MNLLYTIGQSSKVVIRREGKTNCRGIVARIYHVWHVMSGGYTTLHVLSPTECSQNVERVEQIAVV